MCFSVRPYDLPSLAVVCAFQNIVGLVIVKELLMVDEDAGVRIRDLRLRDLPFIRWEAWVVWYVHLVACICRWRGRLLCPLGGRTPTLSLHAPVLVYTQIAGNANNHHCVCVSLLQRGHPVV